MITEEKKENRAIWKGTPHEDKLKEFVLDAKGPIRYPEIKENPYFKTGDGKGYTADQIKHKMESKEFKDCWNSQFTKPSQNPHPQKDPTIQNEDLMFDEFFNFRSNHINDSLDNDEKKENHDKDWINYTIAEQIPFHFTGKFNEKFGHFYLLPSYSVPFSFLCNTDELTWTLHIRIKISVISSDQIFRVNGNEVSIKNGKKMHVHDYILLKKFAFSKECLLDALNRYKVINQKCFGMFYEKKVDLHRFQFEEEEVNCENPEKKQKL